jgi:predicted RNase H-like HicB family nuclease
VIELEDDVYVALCPEFDIASQGSTIEDARTNLIEALTLFFETADRDEIQLRGRSGVFVRTRCKERSEVARTVDHSDDLHGLLPPKVADHIRVKVPEAVADVQKFLVMLQGLLEF